MEIIGYSKLREIDGCVDQYVICYDWKKRDTNEAGTFIGHFHINFTGNVVAEGMLFPKGELILPIQEDLIIKINDSCIFN